MITMESDKISKINKRVYDIKGTQYPLNCPYCNHDHIVKSGVKYRKVLTYYYHLYKCTKCDKKFVWDDNNLGMRNDIKIISTAMYMIIVKKQSLRNVADILSNEYGIKISHVTINNWKQKYLKSYQKHIVQENKIMVSEEIDNRQLPPTIAHLYLGDYFEGALEIKDEYSFRMAETMMESIANTLGIEPKDKNAIKISNNWKPNKC